MTFRCQKPSRNGFTLLEMILALAVGLVLMWALYTMMGTQLAQTQAGRDSVEEATLVRSILARIARDVGGSLGPYDPKQVPSGSSATSTTTDADSASADTAPAATSGPIVFNHGIRYDGSQLILSISRVPSEVLAPDTRRLEDTTLPKVSDLRRMIYWIDESKGLAYQEVKRITANDAESTESDEPVKYIPEVKALTLQFWDGAAWVADWDSSTPGADGETPIGPPAAIEIVLEMRFRGRLDETEPAEPRTYRHVINVPTGNNYGSSMTP
ncbi:MAG: prepilin-type N-terminal cleavage/methylation domain-containing protein [Gemmataceae bacterium]|nr:prepilin-type N-terminal cleavage/methylation domain-containing protein [Gemmataceae bacterium]